MIESEFMNNPNRGAKVRSGSNGSDYYTVMAAAQRAGAKHVFLIENGFHDNEYDEMVLLEDENLREIANIQAGIIATFLGVDAPETTAPEVNTELTAIAGGAVAGVEQARAYINALNPAARDIAVIYFTEGEREGIRGDVAFAQACLETGNFTYAGSAVTPSQNNFCGMGVTGAGVKGNSFATPTLGVRAHIQHLKAYAGNTPLNLECVDPRFSFVQRGIAPYVEYLGIKENPSGKGWAAGEDYGEKILRILSAILKTELPAKTPAPPAASFSPYAVRVTTDNLNIRKGAGTNYATCGAITDKGIYTIIEESIGVGAKRWGKLKSGAGWVSLDFTEKV